MMTAEKTVIVQIDRPISRELEEGYSSVAQPPDPPKTIRSLASRPPTLQAGKIDSASAERVFHDSQDISHIVILDNVQSPVGLLTRSRLYIKTGGAYGYALFANKLVDSLASSEFIVAHAESTVSEVAVAAMSRNLETLYDPIVVVEKPGGRFLGSVTVKDLLESAESALVKAKQKAEAAAKLKSEFLSAMSHEIRTPLNAIVNMGRALRNTKLDKFQTDCLETLSESSEHLLGVVNNILDFSRLEAGRLSIESVNFSVFKLLSFCERTGRMQVQGKPVELLLESDSSLPEWLRGDPLRIRQVLLNLLGNAAKFTTSGSITLKAQQMARLENGASKILFSVADTGVGIPRRILPGIFKRFSQGDISTCRMYGGSGLGLSICRQLVELMGGSIWVDSVEGRGSVFSFTLSLPEGEPSNAIELEPPPAERHERFVKINALLVEDNPFNVKVAKLLFGEMGHALVCATSGAEALEELKKSSFDMVLTDIEMPGMDGFELTRLIRDGQAGEEAAAIPIIAISAHVGESWRQRCLDSGMDAYLSKPVDPQELASMLRRFRPKPKPLADTQEIFDGKTTRLRVGGSERLVKEMRRIFTEETPSMLRAARKALSVNDLQALKICAHSLKSNAASVDAKLCSEMAKALEDAAKSEDAAKCAALLPQVESMLTEAVNALLAKLRK